MIAEDNTIKIHNRMYRIPKRPVAVVCVDGFDPEYLQAGIEDGILPNLAGWTKTGFHMTAKCAMPSLTNPNNLSIITGASTAAHGVSGNYYLDQKTGKEIMVLDDSSMTGETILQLMANKGVTVAAITAKDKLRRIINHGLSTKDGAICFSAQYADQCTVEENGIENVEDWLGKKTPEQYSGDLSIFVLDAGVKLLQEGRADLFYLTLSDFIQHKYAPRSRESDDFMAAIDSRLGELENAGATVVVTGDHGMSDKSRDDDAPNVVFLEDVLNSKWPDAKARVICPIADPFVKHHGALGGFVRVHLLGNWDQKTVSEMLEYLQAMSEIEVAYRGHEAAAVFEMPSNMEGELVVISKKNVAIGGSQDDHDLTQLQGHRLRSHGGLSEQAIPLIASKSIKLDGTQADRVWRNFDAFDVALNY